MAHTIKVSLQDVELGNIDAKVEVKSDKGKIGELFISKGGIEYKPVNAKEPGIIKMTWLQFHKKLTAKPLKKLLSILLFFTSISAFSHPEFPRQFKGNGTFKFTLLQLYKLIDKPSTLKEFEAVAPDGDAYDGKIRNTISDSGYVYAFGGYLGKMAVNSAINLTFFLDANGYIRKICVNVFIDQYALTEKLALSAGFITSNIECNEGYCPHYTGCKVYEKNKHILESCIDIHGKDAGKEGKAVWFTLIK
jgi:hypothetical protein